MIDKDEGRYVRRWGAKVFSRLEWPDFISKLEEHDRGIGSVQRPFNATEDVDKSSGQSGTFAAWLAGRYEAYQWQRNVR